MEPITPPHICWCIAFLKEDGSDAGRYEYVKTEERAKEYQDKCTRYNTARIRVFPMTEVR